MIRRDKENDYIIKKDTMIVFESYLDKTDQNTLDYIFSINESDQNRLMLNITKRLYDKITANITDIDFGTIPMSRGDITKVDNYNELVECIQIIKELLEENKQKTFDNIDQVILAIENVKEYKNKFELGFKLNDELVSLIYSSTVLAIISSVGFMISSCIQYITNPDDSIDISIDKARLKNTNDNLLFNNLKSFNNSCKKGQMALVLDTCNKKGSKELLGVLDSFVLLNGAFLVAIALSIIPFLRELIYFFYYSRVKISDYFELQSELLEKNAHRLNSKGDRKSKEIAKRQIKISDNFKSIANKVAVTHNAAEDRTMARIKSEDKDINKMTVDSTTGELTSSSLF